MHDHAAAPPPLERALVWLRRDLRSEDHAALHHALRAARQVWCGFVFDRVILDALPRADRRVEFILASLHDLDAQLARLGRAHGHTGVGLLLRHGKAADELPALAQALGVQAVYASHDDDPYALARDAAVRGRLAEAGIALHTMKDHVVWERAEVVAGSGASYRVFTPYLRAWKQSLIDHPQALEPRTVAPWAAHLAPAPPGLNRDGLPTLQALGFQASNLATLKLPTGEAGAEALWAEFQTRLPDYHRGRDFPAVKAPSYLSVHLRFGTISVRRLVRHALQRSQAGCEGATVWLAELAWREFYHQLLHHHPRVVGHAFQPAMDAIRWAHGREADAHFEAWCAGRTGYPLVDAGMRQLAATGYLHNRLRMVCGSFLVKHLGLDWRRGEAWFAQQLNDFDLAANSGGWQWVASTGCDAQPWFRIFNPMTQSRRFDPHGRFIRRYLPELAALPDEALHAPWENEVALAAAGIVLGRDYPAPIVDHAAARAATLERYSITKDTGPGATGSARGSRSRRA